MVHVFNSRILLSLIGLTILTTTMFLFCTGELNNPLDSRNPNYVPPSITIDTTGNNIGNGDSISTNSVTIMVKGNRTESTFRACIDSSTCTEWKSSGTFQFDSLLSGSHTVIIESKYEGWDFVTTETIVFFIVDKIPDTAKTLTSFEFANLQITGTINEDDKTVAITVPSGTDVTELVATFTTTGAAVNVDTTIQISDSTTNDFTDPVTYTVEAADGSKQDYVVTVTVSSNAAKELTSFSFVTPAVMGTIDETAKTVAITVPSGTDVTDLKATFAFTGSFVKVGSAAQTSGTTTNDFTEPVTYTVEAANGSKQGYVVTVSVSPNTAKELTSFSFGTPDVAGTIDETAKTVAITVPSGTDVTDLKATFVFTGSSVKVGSVVQTSGTTTNDFTEPVTYTVEAANGSKQDYVVTVSVSPNTAKALTSFSFVTPAVAGTIDETAKTVAVTVPFGTDVTELKATFVSTGASVKVGSAAQTSGTTVNDFTEPVIYTVEAANGSKQDYVVTVSVSPNTAKELTSFRFATPAVAGTIDETAKTVAVTVPSGTDVTDLKATFTFTGSSVKVGAGAQTSGTTVNDFTEPVIYTVEAANGSKQDYVVTVSVSPSTAKELTSFRFATPAVAGTINETTKTVAITVPFGTDVTDIKATFVSTGSSVKVGSTAQTSSTTVNDFTEPVIYTVEAGDGSKQQYVVTVTITPNTAKVLSTFSFTSPAVTGAIDEDNKTVSLSVPFGTDVTDLKATFSTTGSSVKVGATVQVSGTTANNFTAPVTYSVTAVDGSKQDYVVTVTVSPNNAKTLSTFRFTTPAVNGAIDEDNKTIAVTVPFGTDVTNLVATFTTTGASVKVGTTVQISGTTPKDFTSPVTYTVTAGDNSTQNYVVTVSVEAPISIAFKDLTANGTSNSVTTTALSLIFDSDPTTLTAGNITVTGATKGTLTGTGLTRTLAISNITVANGATVSVAVTSPAGFAITGSPQTAVVYKASTPLTFSGLAQVGGTSNSVTSTALTLTFDSDPTTLTAGNITVTGATKGTLTGTGLTRTLAITNITVANGATVSVAVASPAGFTITGSPQTTMVFKAPTAVSFSDLSANGTSNSVTTTTLTLTFDVDPATLAASDITVSGATKGALTGTGVTRTLAITNITVANGATVSVAVASPAGFAITGSPRTVAVYKAAIPATYLSLTQIGGTSNTISTTALVLTFDVDPTTLTVNDITVTGATKGTLTGTGLTRTLTISSITVANGTNVSVVVSNPVGFTITGSPQTTPVYKFSLTMVSVPTGTFLRDETVTNTSTVSAFRISTYEITRAQFLSIMGTDPSRTIYSSGLSDPVQNTSWYQAIAFCNKLSIAEGLTQVYSVPNVNFATLTYADIPTVRNAAWDATTATRTNTGYRLPTEMEWMWAAMGATAGGDDVSTIGYNKIFAGSTGSNAKGDYAVFGAFGSEPGRTPTQRTNPVGSKTANELGLYDMSGNVEELCWDWYGIYPTGARTDYLGAETGTKRHYRGGGWSNANCSLIDRNKSVDPNEQYDNIGFRVVLP